MASTRSRPTIYDVARIAGVSANTVSRVLNGKSGVSDATRARILEIMEKVGYYPHIGARSLRGSRKGCIGVALPAPIDRVPISQDLFIWLFSELYRVFGSQGERICFDMNPYKVTPNGDYARSIWEELYSACVLAGPLAVDDTIVHRIHASGIPYLAFGRLDSLPECSCATSDYDEGAYMSMKFLLNRGHKKVAMLKALTGFQPGVERRRGYMRALQEAELPFEERLLQSVTFGARDIAGVVHRVLSDRKVTAIIDASGTEDAFGIREGARRAGRVPGKDFDVICWTYSNRTAVMSEACAHLWLPAWEAAAEGLELLSMWFREEIEGPVHVVYPPTLLEDVPEVEMTKPKRLFDMLV